MLGKNWPLGCIVCDVFVLLPLSIQWPKSGVVHDCIVPDLCLLSCFVFVRNGLMLENGH